MAKTKKETKKKAPKIETIKVGVELGNTVTHNNTKYYLQENGNYLNSTTRKEVKLVRG